MKLTLFLLFAILFAAVPASAMRRAVVPIARMMASRSLGCLVHRGFSSAKPPMMRANGMRAGAPNMLQVRSMGSSVDQEQNNSYLLEDLMDERAKALKTSFEAICDGRYLICCCGYEQDEPIHYALGPLDPAYKSSHMMCQRVDPKKVTAYKVQARYEILKEQLPSIHILSPAAHLDVAHAWVENNSQDMCGLFGSDHAQSLQKTIVDLLNCCSQAKAGKRSVNRDDAVDFAIDAWQSKLFQIPVKKELLTHEVLDRLIAFDEALQILALRVHEIDAAKD
jgi:hypothetical protein